MEKSRFKLGDESIDNVDSKSTHCRETSAKKIGYSKITNDLVSLISKRKVKASESSANQSFNAEKSENNESFIDENNKKNISSVNMNSRVSKSIQTEQTNDKILNYSIMDVETLRYQLENEIDSHIETEDLYEKLKQEFAMYRTNTRSFIDEKQKEIIKLQQTITQLQLNNQLLINVHNTDLTEINNLNQQILQIMNDRNLNEESFKNELKLNEEKLNELTAEKVTSSKKLLKENEIIDTKVKGLQNEITSKNYELIVKTTINNNQTIEIEKLQSLISDYQRESYSQFNYFKGIISRNHHLNNLLNGEHSVDIIVPTMKNQMDSNIDNITNFENSATNGSSYQSTESLNYIGNNKLYNNHSELKGIKSKKINEKHYGCYDYEEQFVDRNKNNKLKNIKQKEDYNKYLNLNQQKINLTPRYISSNSNIPSIDKFMSQQMNGQILDSNYTKKLVDSSNTHYNQQGINQYQKVSNNINILPKYTHHQYL